MVFDYPTAKSRGKHAPWGYKRYSSYKDWLRDEFAFRCVYCLEREQWYPTGADAFGVDHIKPQGIVAYKKLKTVYENLTYACNRCNARKGKILLLDPRDQPFGIHLAVRSNGKVDGLTTPGKILVKILGLNEPEIIEIRSHYVDVYKTFQDPKRSKDPFVRRVYIRAFGFPRETPDLTRKRAKGNNMPLGVRKCFFQRLRGRGKEVVFFGDSIRDV
jgi:HNH endonuclease